MNAKKFYFVSLGIVIGLLLLLGGSIYFMNQYLQKGSNDLVQAKLESRVDEERERYYLQAKKDLEKYKDISATLVKVLPKDKDQAKAVAEIGRIADESGIEIKQISFPSSTLGEKKAAATTTTTTPAAGSTPAASTPSVTQAKPVEGVSGVLGIDTQVQFISTETKKLSYTQLITFLEKVEKNRRTMQVSSISITPKNNNQIDAAISLRIFVKP
jgi:Tfp pilus assembly protein PilO